MPQPAPTPKTKRNPGCLPMLLLVLGLLLGGLSLMVKGLEFYKWTTVEHVTATALGDRLEQFGSTTQGTAGNLCTRYYQVPGYPEAKSATISCGQFLPPGPDAGEPVEVAYDGSGSPVAFADIFGVGLQELVAACLVPLSIVWLLALRRRR